MNELVSVIIPAYNEYMRIIPALEKITRYMGEQSRSFEIIVIDDGSSDGTVESVGNFIKKTGGNISLYLNGKNFGKGYSVKRGMLLARGDYRLFTDADLSTPIEETERFLKEISAGYDVVIASRSIEGSDIAKRQPFYREFMGRTFNRIIKQVLNVPYKDTQCGFKMFTADAAKTIFGLLKTEGFAFDVELILIALKKGYKIKELPVKWINSPVSRVKIFSDSLKMIAQVLALKRLYK
jgi:dolichyl-phosphate beta-glucosyltransferase